MGKMILILLTASIILFGVISLSLNSKINNSTEQVVDDYNAVQVRDICNSTAQILIGKLGDNPDLRINSPQSINLLNGSAIYTITNTFMDGDSLIKLNITGNYHSEQKNIKVYLKNTTGNTGFIPPAVLAAISANTNVQTLGNLIVDGRDHDLEGNVIGNSGKVAVWTTKNCNRSGNSRLGGTFGKINYSPSEKSDDFLIRKRAHYPGGYPETPEDVLGGSKKGYGENSLKRMAMSGENGCQYVTDPSELHYPLKGITYVDMSGDDDNEGWNHADIEGSGILIVHNHESNSVIKNINSGTFKGLIIADNIVHIHSDIIGAVVCLSNKSREGNCIGNGNGKVLYSSEAIKNAVSKTRSGSGQGFGFANHRLMIKDWYE